MSTSRQEVAGTPAPETTRPATPAAPTTHHPPRVLSRVLALDDFEAEARRYLPRPIFGYISGGAETNAALRGNREVWDEIQIVPKALVDVSGRTQKTMLFGRTYDAPSDWRRWGARPWPLTRAMSFSPVRRRRPTSR